MLLLLLSRRGGSGRSCRKLGRGLSLRSSCGAKETLNLEDAQSAERCFEWSDGDGANGGSGNASGLCIVAAQICEARLGAHRAATRFGC